MTNTVDPTGGLGRVELLRRLEGVAAKAVEIIAPGRAVSLTLLNQSENTTYLVTDTASGATRILRIHRTGYHTPAAIASEHAWMAALKADAGVHTPDVIADPDGATVHRVATEALPDGRVCVFFEHLAGEEPDADNLLPSMPNLGAVTARMHRHVERWTPPPGFERFSWNCQTILGETPHWGHWYDGPNLNAERIALFGRVAATIERRLKAFGMGRDRYGLVHADMRVANLLIHQGDTRVIDFDDAGFGWYLHDLGTALSFIEHRPEVPELVAAWLEGYRRERPMSQAEEDEIPSFLMLRRMQILAWTGSHSETDLARELGEAATDQSVGLADRYLTKFG